MKKITLLLFLMNVTFLFAQKEISGKIMDSSGVGLPGANNLLMFIQTNRMSGAIRKPAVTGMQCKWVTAALIIMRVWALTSKINFILKNWNSRARFFCLLTWKFCKRIQKFQ